MTEAIAEALRNQYRAALSTLEECIKRCPDSSWDRKKDGNRFWHVAYHAMFYTALYLSTEEAPILWKGCRAGYHGFRAGPWAPGFDPDKMTPYTKEELLQFLRWLRKRVKESCLDASTDEPSQFSWLRFSRFELHVYNIRHLVHHVGQLAERLKQQTEKGVAWKGMS